MKQNIVNMKQSAVNRLHSFGGHDAINLGRAIRKHAGKFHQVPVGPLGYFLSLEESRYALPKASIVYTTATFDVYLVRTTSLPVLLDFINITLYIQ